MTEEQIIDGVVVVPGTRIYVDIECAKGVCTVSTADDDLDPADAFLEAIGDLDDFFEKELKDFAEETNAKRRAKDLQDAYDRAMRGL